MPSDQLDCPITASEQLDSLAQALDPALSTWWSTRDIMHDNAWGQKQDKSESAWWREQLRMCS
jgi:hypothetical protein